MIPDVCCPIIQIASLFLSRLPLIINKGKHQKHSKLRTFTKRSKCSQKHGKNQSNMIQKIGNT